MPVKFTPIRVVALDSNGLPISKDPKDWQVSVNIPAKQLNLTCNRFQVIYRFEEELLHVTVTNKSEEIDLGKTLSRMALSGLSASYLRKKEGSGIGGALLDLSVRGSEKTVIAEGVLCFTDTSLIKFEATKEELAAISTIFPADSFSEKSRTKFERMLEKLKRMVEDGAQILPEIAASITKLSEQLKEAEDNVAKGTTFEERDAARDAVRSIKSQISDLQTFHKIVGFELREPEKIAVIKSATVKKDPFTKNVAIICVLAVLSIGLAQVIINNYVNIPDKVEDKSNVDISGYLHATNKANYEFGRDAANKKDFETALKVWEPLASKGNPDAQYSLGMMYLRGDGVTKNPLKARHLIELAAGKGHVRALDQLVRWPSN